MRGTNVADRAADLHRPRCCSNPTPEATWGLGVPDVAFVTVWCTNCNTDLVSLVPPSAAVQDPYVGPYRHTAEATS